MRLAPLYNVLVKSWGASGRLGHHAANATTQPMRHVPAMQLIAKVRLNLLIVLLHFFRFHLSLRAFSSNPDFSSRCDLSTTKTSRDGCRLIVQVKIWFQNHRYKLKKAGQERGTTTDAAPTSEQPCSTSARRVTVPVLVRDGQRCQVAHSAQPSASYYSLSYGDSRSTAALAARPQGTGMESARASCDYHHPSCSGTAGHHSRLPTKAVSINSIMTQLYTAETSTSPAAAAAYYRQSRW